MDEMTQSRLMLGRVLINRFEELSKDLDPAEGNLDEVIYRATHAREKMHLVYLKVGEPPELLEQIKKMDSVIKKVEKLQNNHRVTDM
jgi:hypothetical protein